MIEQFFSPQVVQALGWTLVHTLWQGALFALITGILLVVLRRFSAQARYVVTVGMLAAFFITVVFTFGRQFQKAPGPVSSLPESRVEEPAAETDLSAVLIDKITQAQEGEPSSVVMDDPPRFQQRMINYFDAHLPLIVTLWLMGVFVLQLRFLGQLAFVQRLRNYGANRFPAEWAGRIQVLEEQLGINKPVQYLSSFRINSPFTTGWLRPAVLFPEALLRELEDSQILAILAHELAHIKRNDFLVNLIQTLLCILFFYHPGVWWMSARIKDEREHCCDDLAIQLTQQPLGYAKTLIHLKEKEMNITNKVAVAFTGSKPQGFRQRITRLVSGYLRTATYSEGVITAFILVFMMGTAVFASQYHLDELPTKAQAIDSAAQGPSKQDSPILANGDHDTDVDTEAQAEAFADADLMDADFDIDFSSPSVPLTDFELLMEAVDDGNLRLVKYFLEQGVDVNQTNRRGFSPLMLAASEDHPEIAQELINAGAEVNFINDHGWTALIEAADEGSYATAIVLLEAGADVNLRGSQYKRTAAAMAASEGHASLLELLIERGADWSGRNGASPPLHLAAEEGQYDVMKMLLDRGVDVNAKDEHGRTALFYAAEEGKVSIVKLLLANGADANAQDDNGRTPLAIAAEEDQSTVATILLEAGANASIQDASGRSALDYAAEEGAEDVLGRLMSSDPAIRAEALRPSTLVNAAGEGELGILQELVEAGADVNAADESGYTPLMEAAREGELQTVRYLLDKGAAVDPASGATKPSALFLAAGESAPMVMQLLIERGANLEFKHTIQSININSRRNTPNQLSIYKSATPLFVAVEEEDLRSVQLLLDKGANVNASIQKKTFELEEHTGWKEVRKLNEENATTGLPLRYDASNWTLLMEAAEKGELLIVDALLKAGADKNARNSIGQTARDVALRMGHPEIADRLN